MDTYSHDAFFPILYLKWRPKSKHRGYLYLYQVLVEHRNPERHIGGNQLSESYRIRRKQKQRIHVEGILDRKLNLCWKNHGYGRSQTVKKDVNSVHFSPLKLYRVSMSIQIPPFYVMIPCSHIYISYSVLCGSEYSDKLDVLPWVSDTSFSCNLTEPDIFCGSKMLMWIIFFVSIDPSQPESKNDWPFKVSVDNTTGIVLSSTCFQIVSRLQYV